MWITSSLQFTFIFTFKMYFRNCLRNYNCCYRGFPYMGTQEESWDDQKQTKKKNMAILKWNVCESHHLDRLSEVISFLTFVSKLIFCISLISMSYSLFFAKRECIMQHKGHRHKSGYSEECRNEEMLTHSQSHGFELQSRMLRLLRGMLRLIFSRCQPIHT